MSKMNKSVNYVAQPALSGVVAGAAWRAKIGRKGIPIMGKAQPVEYVVGGAQAVGSLASELVHSAVFPHIPNHEKWSGSITAAMKVGIPAAAVYAILQSVNPTAAGDMGNLNILGVSLASEAISSYVYEQFVFPWMNGRPYDSAQDSVEF